jgi:putative inorganic carbon (HCO3(-)) transporter
MKGLILTYIITATATVGALRYPLIGLYVYVGFSVLRPQSIWGFAGDLSNLSLIVGIAMLVGWVLRGFGSWQFGRGRPIVVALLAFSVWFAIAAMFALDTSRSLDSCVTLSKFVLPFLVGVTLLEGNRRWIPMLWTIVLCQGYVGFEMNLNYLVKGVNTAADGFGGMDNNCFAVSLITVLGPAVTLVLLSKKWYARVLAAVAAGLILHSTLLTFSRGALIGLIAVAVTAFVLMPKRPKYLAAVLVAVLLAVRFTGPQLAARYATTFASADQRDSSAESRIDLWRDCITVIESYPMLGVGPANWRVIASNYGWPEGKSAHSVWMETAAEVGVPGVLFLMLFFSIAAIRLWPIARIRQTDANRYDVALAIGVVLSIVGFAVGGQFVSVPGLEVPYYITMVGVAMLKTRSREAAALARVPVVAPPSLDLPVLPSRSGPAAVVRSTQAAPMGRP